MQYLFLDCLEIELKSNNKHNHSLSAGVVNDDIVIVNDIA